MPGCTMQMSLWSREFGSSAHPKKSAKHLVDLGSGALKSNTMPPPLLGTWAADFARKIDSAPVTYFSMRLRCLRADSSGHDS
jgi:hypothetical protein